MIFEVGDCTILNQTSRTGVSDVKKLACLSIHSSASFSEIKAVLNAFLLSFGIEYDLRETSHGTFIEGRVGVISFGGKELGFVGEINPEVLEKWKLGNPAVGFEVNLSLMFSFGDRAKDSIFKA